MEKTAIIQFSLGSLDYGIDVNQTVEVDRFVSLTQVPRMPRFVEGFLNLRGRFMVVTDLRKLLGLKARKPDSETRIIIVEVADDQFGIIVDAVNDIKQVSDDEIQPPGEYALKVSNNFVTGVVSEGKEFVIILNLHALMYESEIKSMRETLNEYKSKTKK